jgi:hypothetical protein
MKFLELKEILYVQGKNHHALPTKKDVRHLWRGSDTLITNCDALMQ